MTHPLISWLIIIALITRCALGREQAASTTVEKRAYVSNGVTCYYKCALVVQGARGPAIFDQPQYYGTTASICLYEYPSGSAAGICIYDSSTGEFIGNNGEVRNCPQPAIGPICASPTIGSFKRSTISRDVPAVRERQFRPVIKDNREPSGVEPDTAEESLGYSPEAVETLIAAWRRTL